MVQDLKQLFVMTIKIVMVLLTQMKKQQQQQEQPPYQHVFNCKNSKLEQNLLAKNRIPK
jgi:hypothetical protein